jgi:phage shock protein E
MQTIPPFVMQVTVASHAIPHLCIMNVTLLRRWLPSVAGILLGALAGYLYYREVGCASGTCAITSRPLNSTLYGAVMGYLLAGIVAPLRRKA